MTESLECCAASLVKVRTDISKELSASIIRVMNKLWIKNWVQILEQVGWIKAVLRSSSMVWRIPQLSFERNGQMLKEVAGEGGQRTDGLLLSDVEKALSSLPES
ncbi:hypothetical protein L798_08276 [Zootermopsis nevadensis]|uniref:Uncharacterized protein n=1 Tax=Zootermopsis nevadensis TaxID=136037 RepID=A0A067R4P0_ZOONE|nr:hypothetical protein L798_08276 [Zootermopsis nevadensis]